MRNIYDAMVEARHEAIGKGDKPASWSINRAALYALMADERATRNYSSVPFEETPLFGIPMVVNENHDQDCRFSLNLHPRRKEGMTPEEFREGMSRADRENHLFLVLANGEPGIAVGMDSSRGVVILHDKREVPWANIVEWCFESDLPVSQHPERLTETPP